MKDRTWFNRKLFWDTMRQLRMMGITYLGICVVVSCMPAVVLYIDKSASVIPISLFVPSLYLLMTIGTVTVVFGAFSYLFSRRASDYFDALPTKRVGVAISRFSASIAWIWGIVISTSLVTVLAYGLLCGQWYWNYLPWLCGYYCTVSLFFAAACLCGVSLAGTRFSAFVVAGLVAFAIRFLLLQFAYIITSFAPAVSYRGFGLLLNPYGNIATASVMAPFGINEMADPYDIVRMMTSAGPMLYTFAIGLVYAAAGMWFYRIRKSETAGRSAPNKTLQALYRCGITMPVILSFVIEYFMAKYNNPSINFTGLIITALISSLMVYLIFEIITQRKLKGLWKTLPYYAVLMAFCVLFVFAGKSVADAQRHITVESGNISGVTLIANEYEASYTDFKTEDVVLHDQTLNALLASALNRNAVWDEDPNAYQYDVPSVTVRIDRIDGGSIYRNVFLTDDETQTLKTLLMKNREYMQRLRQFPEESEIELYNLDAMAMLTDQQTRTLYGLMKTDMQKLSDKDFASLLVDVQADFNGGKAIVKTNLPIATLKLLGHSNYQSFRYYVDLTTLTPNALAYYIGIAQEQLAESFAKSIPADDQNGKDGRFTLTLIDLKSGNATQAVEAVGTGQAAWNNKQMSAFALVRQATGQKTSDFLLQIEIRPNTASDDDSDKYDQGIYYEYLTAEQAHTLQALLEFK